MGEKSVYHHRYTCLQKTQNKRLSADRSGELALKKISPNVPNKALDR